MGASTGQNKKRATTIGNRIKIFCCYAHEDQSLLSELKNHLAPLQREGKITLWADTDVNAGVEWEKEISRHLNTAQIILLLISPDFMASDSCYSVEMQQAMERHECGDARVIPIILRSVDWQSAPFGKLQALPTGAEPVQSRGWQYPDDAFWDVAREIRKVVEGLIETEYEDYIGKSVADTTLKDAEPRKQLLEDTLLPPIFPPSQPPVVHRRLAKWQSILSVGLLLALIGSDAFIMMFIPFIHTSTLTPSLMTATAIADAEHAYATSIAKNGIMFGFDSAHTHQNPYEKVINRTNVSRLKPVWSYATGDSIISSPALANGLVYVGSSDHKLYAFDATCRKHCLPLWSYTTGDRIESSPAIANGLVYVGSDDRKLYAFDATCHKDCLPLWSYATAGPIVSSPAVANELVYVGSDDRKLYTFDATCHKDCLPLWSYATGGPIVSSPAVANELVYVGTDDDKLYAFDAACRKDCLPLWSHATGGPIVSSPAVANGLVYVGSWDHKLYAFDATCRKHCLPLWSYTIGDLINSSPAVTNGLVYVSSWDHKLYAFDATCRKDCLPLWSYATSKGITSSPAVANGLVYVGSYDDKLYAFDATCRKDCLPLWSYTTGGRIRSSPAVVNGLLYVSSGDHKLYAFGITAK